MFKSERTNPADKAQEFMHSKKQNVKRAQKQGRTDGSKVPTSGGKQPRPQGEPGMNYAGGTPGFYDKGGPGHGGGNGARRQRPTNGPEGYPAPNSPGSRPSPGRGSGSGPDDSGYPQPPQFGGGQFGGGRRPKPQYDFSGGQPPQFGGGQPPQFADGRPKDYSNLTY